MRNICVLERPRLRHTPFSIVRFTHGHNSNVVPTGRPRVLNSLLAPRVAVSNCGAPRPAGVREAEIPARSTPDFTAFRLTFRTPFHREQRRTRIALGLREDAQSSDTAVVASCKPASPPAFKHSLPGKKVFTRLGFAFLLLTPRPPRSGTTAPRARYVDSEAAAPSAAAARPGPDQQQLRRVPRSPRLGPPRWTSAL